MLTTTSLCKTAQLQSFDDYLTNLPECELRDILDDCRNEIERQIRCDFGFLTDKNLRRVSYARRSELSDLADRLKTNKAIAKTLEQKISRLKSELRHVAKTISTTNDNLADARTSAQFAERTLRESTS